MYNLIETTDVINRRHQRNDYHQNTMKRHRTFLSDTSMKQTIPNATHSFILYQPFQRLKALYCSLKFLSKILNTLLYPTDVQKYHILAIGLNPSTPLIKTTPPYLPQLLTMTLIKISSLVLKVFLRIERFATISVP